MAPHQMMNSSSALTRGIRISVESVFDPSRSRPSQAQWFFLYTVTITNEGSLTVQLNSRHWIITDSAGRVEEVKGAGVVGEQPVLEPGSSFEYTSGCPLTTDYGTMHGSYQMITEDGESIDAKIKTFTLMETQTVH